MRTGDGPSASSSKGVKVFDLRSPAAPAPTGELGLAGGVDLAVHGRLLAVAREDLGLSFVDITTPAAPELLDTVLPSNTDPVLSVDLSDRWAGPWAARRAPATAGSCGCCRSRTARSR